MRDASINARPRLPATRTARPARTNTDAVAGTRGPLRRLLDMWGFTPGFGVEHHDVTVHARDGVPLRATYLPAVAPVEGRPAVVLAHGFASHRRKPPYAYLAERLAEVASVLTVDLRGHGASGGRCTLGAQEILDVRAAAVWLRREGHPWVAAVGASMGATAALRAAGTGPPGVFDALCAISAPAVWGLVDTPAMRTLTRVVCDPRLRVLAGAALRVRLASGGWPRGIGGLAAWQGPPQPVEVVARIAPTPLLVVHGVDDHFYGAEQAHLLHDAALPPKTLWLEAPGFGHAEDGFSPVFATRFAAAITYVHEHGRWPAHPAHPLTRDPVPSAPAP